MECEKSQRLQLLKKKKECLLAARDYNAKKLTEYNQEEKKLLRERDMVLGQRRKLDTFEQINNSERAYYIGATLFMGTVFTAVSSVVSSNIDALSTNIGIGVSALIGTEAFCYGAKALIRQYQLSSIGDLDEFELHAYDVGERLKSVSAGLVLLQDRQEQFSTSIQGFETEKEIGVFTYQKSRR